MPVQQQRETQLQYGENAKFLHATKTNNPNDPRTPELEEQIRARAYEIYEQSGKNEGHEIDDWLQAEAELTGKSETVAA